MESIFQVMFQQSRTNPSLISSLGGFTCLCQSKRLLTVQVTSQVVIRYICKGCCGQFLCSNKLPRYREVTCGPTYVRQSQCVQKGSKILKVFYTVLSCIFGAQHTCHNVFKGSESIEEIKNLQRRQGVLKYCENRNLGNYYLNFFLYY